MTKQTIKNKNSDDLKENLELDSETELKIGFYELAFFLSPQLGESQLKETIDQLTNKIKEEGGEMLYFEIPELKKIAYPIKKQNEGYFSFCQFKILKDKIQDLEKEWQGNEKFLRYLLIKLNPKEDLIKSKKGGERGEGEVSEGLEELKEKRLISKGKKETKISAKKIEEEKEATTSQEKTEGAKEVDLDELEKKINEILNK
ncbi:MAG: 30S ribosomal protein S6 [Candidatus Paceibacterota bacterium]